MAEVAFCACEEASYSRLCLKHLSRRGKKKKDLQTYFPGSTVNKIVTVWNHLSGTQEMIRPDGCTAEESIWSPYLLPA